MTDLQFRFCASAAHALSKRGEKFIVSLYPLSERVPICARGLSLGYLVGMTYPYLHIADAYSDRKVSCHYRHFNIRCFLVVKSSANYELLASIYKRLYRVYYGRTPRPVTVDKFLYSLLRIQ